MNKQSLSIPALDVEDRNKKYEEAILLDGSTIKIYAPYIDAAYFDKEKNLYCLEYDNKYFIYSGHLDAWMEQKKNYKQNKNLAL